jgi:2-iminobutanoate/2-iminopropanoate deaminase
VSIERKIVAGAPAPGGCYSHVVVHGGLAYCAGQTGVDPDTRELREGVEEQTRQAIENLATVLGDVGASLSDVIQARVFVRDYANFAVMNAVFEEFFGEHRPARTTIPCSGFPQGLEVEIDVIAALE